jgi:hypothetical protein
MANLESKLLSEDKDWLSGTNKTTEEAFVVVEYFARYVRKRWPKDRSEQSASDRGHLYLELIDVEFRPPEEVSRKLVRLGFASDTLQILLPDKGYSEEEKETLRDFYQQKYSSVIKESHSRTNALLWQTFSMEEREDILRMFEQNTRLQTEIKEAIQKELERAGDVQNSHAIKMQTRNPFKSGDEK